MPRLQSLELFSSRLNHFFGGWGIFLLWMNLKHLSPAQTCLLDFRLVYSANCLISISTWMPNQYCKFNMTKTNCLSSLHTLHTQTNLSCAIPITENNRTSLLTLESFLTLFPSLPSPPSSSSNPSVYTEPIHFFSFCSFYSAEWSKVPVFSHWIITVAS